ncbi:hypothetical protein AA700_0078 [Acidiphilium acidophilum DSM 700]|nr:hypothetical protein AA700_0078 [Acidiphilium acidophilum DSM 700]
MLPVQPEQGEAGDGQDHNAASKLAYRNSALRGPIYPQRKEQMEDSAVSLNQRVSRNQILQNTNQQPEAPN